ncbi:MAG: AbrB/MazE/SpoVT family DNA-binding domain-containing protein [Actinomycetota bacterium]
MRSAIDSAGRVVIPKALRDALGLSAGQPLEISERDGRLEIVPAPTPMRLSTLTTVSLRLPTPTCRH